MVALKILKEKDSDAPTKQRSTELQTKKIKPNKKKKNIVSKRIKQCHPNEVLKSKLIAAKPFNSIKKVKVHRQKKIRAYKLKEKKKLVKDNANIYNVNQSHNLKNDRLEEEISGKIKPDDNPNGTETKKKCTNIELIKNEYDGEHSKKTKKDCRGLKKKNCTGLGKKDGKGSRTGWRIPACILEIVPEQIPRVKKIKKEFWKTKPTSLLTEKPLVTSLSNVSSLKPPEVKSEFETKNCVQPFLVPFNDQREVEKRQTESCIHDAFCRVGQLRKPDTHLAVAIYQPHDGILPQYENELNKSAYIQNLQLYPTDPAVGSKREVSTPHTSLVTNIQNGFNVYDSIYNTPKKNIQCANGKAPSATAGPRKRKQKRGNEDEPPSNEIADVKRAIDFVEQEGSNPTKLSCEDENSIPIRLPGLEEISGHLSPSKLKWNSSHTVNKQGVYCYCGTSGDWYKAMVRCVRCKQWFHERCLQPRPRSMPLVQGDTYYLFVCSVCNYGVECMKRIPITWQQFVHIAVFHLSIQLQKKQLNLMKEIYPSLINNCIMYQVPKCIYSCPDKQSKILDILQFSGLFTSGNSGLEWGLKKMIPPPIPNYTLHYSGVVSERNVLDDAVRCNDIQTKEIIQISTSTSPIETAYLEPRAGTRKSSSVAPVRSASPVRTSASVSPVIEAVNHSSHTNTKDINQFKRKICGKEKERREVEMKKIVTRSPRVLLANLHHNSKLIQSGASNSANHNQNQENKDNQMQIEKKPRKYKRRSELLTFTTKKPKKEQLIVKKKMIKSKAKVLSKKQLKLKMKERKENMKNRKKKIVNNGSDEENEVIETPLELVRPLPLEISRQLFQKGFPRVCVKFASIVPPRKSEVEKDLAALKLTKETQIKRRRKRKKPPVLPLPPASNSSSGTTSPPEGIQPPLQPLKAAAAAALLRGAGDTKILDSLIPTRSSYCGDNNPFQLGDEEKLRGAKSILCTGKLEWDDLNLSRTRIGKRKNPSNTEASRQMWRQPQSRQDPRYFIDEEKSQDSSLILNTKSVIRVTGSKKRKNKKPMRRSFMGFSQSSSQMYDHCNHNKVEGTINHDVNKAFKESFNHLTNNGTVEIVNSEDNFDKEIEKVKVVEYDDCSSPENGHNLKFELKNQVLQHMTTRFKGKMFAKDNPEKKITDDVIENGLSCNGFHENLVDSFDTNCDEKWTNQRMTRSNYVLKSSLTSNDELPRHESLNADVPNNVLVSNGSLTRHNNQQMIIGDVTNEELIHQQCNDEASNEKLLRQLTNSNPTNGIRPRHTVNQLINGRSAGHKVTGRFFGPNGEQRVILQRIPPIARCTEM